MPESVESRLRALARRAGWAAAPPAVVAAGLGLACLAVVVAAWRWWPQPSDEVGSGSAPASERAAASNSRVASAASTTAAPARSAGDRAIAGGSDGSTICVDVVGAVRHPGVYVLGSSARIGTVIEVAGGASPDAATDAINLAAKIEDGEQIVVPTKKQVASGELPDAATAPGSSAVGAAAKPAAKVDLNVADATALDALPGIGPSTAAKIVADRQTNGRFKSVDDLGRVPGIGPKKLASLKDLVVVR